MESGQHRVTRLAPLAALAFFLAAAAVLTWPRLPEAASTVVDYGDPTHHIWRLDYIGRNLFSGTLYDAPIYHGFPLSLAYDDIFVGQALTVNLLSVFTGSTVLSYNLLIVLEFALAGWSTYLLARYVAGSEAGAIMGGVLVAFTSYTFAHLSHANLLALYPIPLALLCLHRLFDAKRLRSVALWAAAFLATALWQSLHSFYYALYLALATGFLLVWETLVVRQWREWSTRLRAGAAAFLLLSFALFAGVVLLLSAPQRAVQREFEFTRSLDEQIAMSAQLTDYFSVSPRNRTYAALLPKVDLDQALFPGFIALVLGVSGAAVLLLRRGAAGPAARQGTPSRSRIAFYLVLMLAGVILSLGPRWEAGSASIPLPYSWLWSLPGLEGLRGPRRLALLALIGWAVLAAYGWRQFAGLLRARFSWLRGATMPGASFASWGITALLVFGMAAEQWTVPTPSLPMPPPPEGYGPPSVPPAYRWLAEHDDGGVLMEFPVEPGNVLRGFPVMYYQTIHRHPLVNGLSSYVPPMYRELMSRLDVGEDPAAGTELSAAQIAMLQSMEVRYLLFNELAYKQRTWQSIAASLAAMPGVTYAGKYDLHHIYVLDPLPDDAHLRLSWRAPGTMRVGASTPVTVTVINPYSSLMLTRLQPSLDLVAIWQSAGAAPSASPMPLVPSGEPGVWQLPGALLPVRSAQFSSLLNVPAVLRSEWTADIDLLVAQGAHRLNLTLTPPATPGKYLLTLTPRWRLPSYRIGPPLEVEVTP